MSAGINRRMKDAAKLGLRALCHVVLAPEFLSYWIRSKLLSPNKALMSSSQLLGLIPGRTGRWLRNVFYSRVLVHCHPSVIIEWGVLFSKTGARLEEKVTIGARSSIGLAHIGRETMLAPGVHVLSGAMTHGYFDAGKSVQQQDGVVQMVRIGEGSWIGTNAVIMADIGNNVVVGAGSVVNKPLSDRAAVMPAFLRQASR